MRNAESTFIPGPRYVRLSSGFGKRRLAYNQLTKQAANPRPLRVQNIHPGRLPVPGPSFKQRERTREREPEALIGHIATEGEKESGRGQRHHHGRRGSGQYIHAPHRRRELLGHGVDPAPATPASASERLAVAPGQGSRRRDDDPAAAAELQLCHVPAQLGRGTPRRRCAPSFATTCCTAARATGAGTASTGGSCARA